MPRQKGRWAKVEVNFVLNDPRYKSLKLQDRAIYIGLWCLCVDLGVETLSPNAARITYLCHALNTHHKTLIAALKRLDSDGIDLVKHEDNGGLTVYGVRKLHPKCVRDGTPAGRDNDVDVDVDNDVDIKNVNVGGSTGESKAPPPSPPSDPMAYWQDHKGDAMTESDVRYIQRLWDRFDGLTICRVMQRARFNKPKPSNLLWCEKVLLAESGKRPEPGDNATCGYSATADGWDAAALKSLGEKR